MLVSWAPEFDLTNSLLMKRPVGRENFLPLGAVRETSRPAILGEVEKVRWRAVDGKPGRRRGREGVGGEGSEGLDKHSGEDSRREDRRSGVRVTPAREARKRQCRAMRGGRGRDTPCGGIGK